MISKLYLKGEASITKLDNLPDDVHGIICEYLNLKHEFAAWRIINEDIDIIPDDIKLYACNQCNESIYSYESLSDFSNERFLNILLDNIEEIVEVRKLITLFYKSSKKSSICINVSEHENINKIISEGYTIEEKEKYYTNYKVFKLTKNPNMKIAPIHMLFALLLCPIKHHICYDYSKMTLDIQFEVYYKTPHVEKLIRYVKKKKILK
jgi:hypothetical protein